MDVDGKGGGELTDFKGGFDVLSIDVGMINLGFIYARVRLGPHFSVHVHDLGRVDLTRYCHRRVPRCRCTLRHDGHVSSRVLHFIQEHRPYFDGARVILVEQQPPGGLTSIEAILHVQFYRKVRAISPVALHAFLRVRGLDYDARKAFMVRFADRHLAHVHAYRTETRKHDVADAFAFIFFFLHADGARTRVHRLVGSRDAPPALAEAHGGDENPFLRFAYRPAAAAAPRRPPAQGRVHVVEEQAGVADHAAAAVAVGAPAAGDADGLRADHALRVDHRRVGVQVDVALGAAAAGHAQG